MQRSLVYLRNRGYFCAIAEHWNPYGRTRQDLCGFIDIVAMGNGQTIAVQTTTAKNISARMEKIQNLEGARIWLECKNYIQVHGWKKCGPRGKRKKWEVVVRPLYLSGGGAILAGEIE